MPSARLGAVSGQPGTAILEVLDIKLILNYNEKDTRKYSSSG
jgi:hypothetical protein